MNYDERRRTMAQVLGQVTEATLPKVIPNLREVLAAEKRLASAVAALEKVRKDVGGVRPTMYWEIEDRAKLKAHAGTPEGKRALAWSQAVLEVSQALDAFRDVFDAWHLATQ
jgi:hypothetical protein